MSEIISKIKELKEKSKKRNFVQSFDLAINLKNIDLKKPENRIKGEILLPHKVKDYKIGFFADLLISQAEGIENLVLIKKNEIENMSKKEVKKLAKKCHMFFAEAQLMPLIGKNLGQILGPKNKLPKPIPPNVSDIKPIIEKATRTVNFSLKTSPVIHCIVGKENMKDEDIEENIKTVIKAIESYLPKGKEQIKNIYLKLTMSKPVELKVA